MSSPSDAEAAILEDPAFAELLVAANSPAGLSVAAIAALKRRFGPEAFAAASRIATARRKAEAKLPEASRLWLDPVRAEQATHQAVAANKARRFANARVIDLCCGVGGDTFALAATAKTVIALDRDPDTIRRLKFNLNVISLANSVLPIVGDAARPPVSTDFLIHIDPDRRARDRSGRPTSKLDEYVPGRDVLFDLMRRFPGGAIKLGPASDFDSLEASVARAGIRVETEIVSLHGECREATLWFGSLAGDSRRRATMLPGGSSQAGRGRVNPVSRDLRNSPGRWLFELDAALIRSGLAGEFAATHGLEAVTPDGGWLIGPQAISSQWASRFEVIEIVPADRKVVRAAARRLGWRSAVAKTRGGVAADKFAGWFEANPAGDTKETLLISKSGDGSTLAILAIRSEESATDKNQTSP